jgi:hypothetical protein
VNYERLWRVYLESGLCLKRKKRRHCGRVGAYFAALFHFAHRFFCAAEILARASALMNLFFRARP